MSEAAPAYDADAPRSIAELLDRIAERRRTDGVEEPSEEEAMALAVEESRAAREILRKKGIR